MLWINTSPVEIFAALYAETHYRFPGFKFSRYYRKRPEIVVDLPRRVEQGTVPVTIIIKDADKFPCKFIRPIGLEFRGEKGRENRLVDLGSEIIEEPLWYKVIDIELPPGKYSVQADFQYCSGKKEHHAFNHNYPGLPLYPMTVNVSTSPLPKPPGYLLGDLHTHSSYTSDYVEYGAPLQAIAQTAKALGLDFAAVTDHTYDMDDMPDDYLRNDPELRKWKIFQGEIAEINELDNNKYAVLIPGQEITVRNHKNRNVHFLLLGDDRLFPGSGDSAEAWFYTWSESSTIEILSMKSENAVSGAAHPQVKPPFLQKLLLNRGVWSIRDVDQRLSALQIANGGGWREIEQGLKFWQSALKQGRKLSLWAGNDAHGNFNLFRQVGLPMWNLIEEDHNIFGSWFTGIAAENSLAGIMAGLSNGATYISDGPAIDLRVDGALPGTTITGGKLQIEVECWSSEEFGRLSEAQLHIFNGQSLHAKSLPLPRDYRFIVTLIEELAKGYTYLTLKTETGRRAVTSAVFIE